MLKSLRPPTLINTVSVVRNRTEPSSNEQEHRVGGARQQFTRGQRC